MRRTWLLNLLLLAALAVAGLRLARFLQEPLPPLPAPPPPAAEEAAPDAAAGEGGATPVTAGDAAADGGAGYDVVVARDLFSPTRGVVPPKAPAADAAPAAKPVPPPKLTLYGVVIAGNERSAYLQEGSGDAKPRKLREGESIAGATLKAIRPDGVTLAWAGGEITVALRTPKEGGAATTPAAAAGRPSTVPAPTQPGVFPRRFPQPGGTAPVATPPGTPIPGVPRLLPPPVEEEEEVIDEDLPEDEEEILDEGDDDTEEEE